ncbi:MAG TPA: peptidoglycan binding domain-containing protein, partial [Candidatus Limnocylindrales bacterium]
MAIADEVLIQPVEAAAPSRPRIWLRLAAGFVLGLVLVGGAAAAGLYAWDQSYEARVLPGVTAAGVNLAGMDRAQATAALDQAYQSVTSGTVVLQTPDGDLSVPYSQFGRRVDTAAMADAALRAGRDGTMAERALGQLRLALTGTNIEPNLLFDERALAAAVAAALHPFERAPIDAQVVASPTGPSFLASRTGRGYDSAAASAAALAIVNRLDAPAEARVLTPAVDIVPARNDANAQAEVNAALFAADRMDTKLIVAFRGQEWKFKAARIRKWIHFADEGTGTVRPMVNLTAITKALKPIAKDVKRPPLSAAFFRARGRVVGVAASRDGLRLDVTATAAAVAQAIADRGRGVASAPVKVQVEKVPPKVTTEEAQKKGPLMQRLGMWKTWFPVSERNFFGANIWLPARIIDKTVLYPGQRFEWWSALGPVTSSRGFGPGGFIAGNHTEPTGALGGGMCSSSTTL